MQDIFSGVINTTKTENNRLKLWLRIQRYTEADFQGWPKMNLKIKMAYFSIFRSEFRKILSQPFAELYRQA